MTAPQGGRELAWGHGEGGNYQSGAPNGLGRGGNWLWSVLYGLVMVDTAYLAFILAVYGLGKAGSQWIFTLEGSGLPLAMVAGLGGLHHSLAGPHCLCNGVCKGHLFSSLPLAAKGGGSTTWSMEVVAAMLGT